MSNTPAWEIPFGVLGKVVEAIPVELYHIATSVATANTILNQDVPQFIKLLEDAAVVVSDKFINFQMDAQLGKEALALCASIKAQLGLGALPAPPAPAAPTKA